MKPISKSKNKGLAKLAKKKPELEVQGQGAVRPDKRRKSKAY